MAPVLVASVVVFILIVLLLAGLILLPRPSYCRRAT